MRGRRFTADFETTTDPNDCRVWAYAICEIGNPENFLFGNTILDFITWCADEKENYTVYFQNLKFDGEYIISFLLEAGFEWIEDRKDRKDLTFTTLITDMGVFYSIEIYFEVGKHRVNKVTILDSMKILNFSVAQIAKDFDLPISKLKIDYDAYREYGHELTEEEIAYIRNDVEIMARALDVMFNSGLTKMTIGSDALAFYKDITPNFKRLFPVFNKELDDVLRRSYKGGFTYVNPIYREKQVENGVVYDVNSMYPAKLAGAGGELLPYGEPIRFEGKYQHIDGYPIYIQIISCAFDLKEGKIPSIQLKKNFHFKENEYLESSKGKVITMALTTPDFELFETNYELSDVTYNGGWAFKGAKGLFKDYVNYWMEQKIKNKKEGRKALTMVAKLMLNSLYGKTGLSTNSTTKRPVLTEEGIVKYELNDPTERKPIYVPCAAFVTAYARKNIIQTSEKIREWSLNKYGEDFYLYTDTDSLHVRVKNEEEDTKELEKIIDVDDYRLGAYKLESRFKRGAYIRQKCYIEEDYDGSLNVTIAGFPKNLAPLVNFDNFKVGFTTEGMTLDDMIKAAKENGATDKQIEDLHFKLRYRHVKGGVILEDTDFSIT